MPVLFNNCRCRQHSTIYRADAFYDLNTTGKHAELVTNLKPGAQCVVATPTDDGDIEFAWFSFSKVVEMPDNDGYPSRVFLGKRLRAETMPKAKGAKTKPYAAFFNSLGHFKRLSVIDN